MLLFSAIFSTFSCAKKKNSFILNIVAFAQKRCIRGKKTHKFLLQNLDMNFKLAKKTHLIEFYSTRDVLYLMTLVACAFFSGLK